MRILIISDTHGRLENYYEVLKRESHIDRLIHCGDLEDSEWEITESCGCPVDMVAGNNDFFSDLPKEKEILVAGKNVLLTHGHNYYVYMDHRILRRESIGRGMDIAMFGHTHRPVVEEDSEITIINPGSLSYPRQEGRRPSYIIMTTDPITYEIKYL